MECKIDGSALAVEFDPRSERHTFIPAIGSPAAFLFWHESTLNRREGKVVAHNSDGRPDIEIEEDGRKIVFHQIQFYYSTGGRFRARSWNWIEPEDEVTFGIFTPAPPPKEGEDEDGIDCRDYPV